MRHGRTGRKLKRTASHKSSTLSSLASSLLRHKRITTTVAKAKETRRLVEQIITRAKRALASVEHDGKKEGNRAEEFVRSSGHARRETARLIRDKAVVSELFSTIAPKVASRPGGYTRIVKLGQRQGDGAELAVIELVDFHAGQESPAKPASGGEKKPRRTKKASAKEVTSAKQSQETPA